jgi:pimeloyl-ACP methyl ester carboxylesterase
MTSSGTSHTGTSRTGTVAVDGGGGGELWFDVTGTGPDVVLAHPGNTDSRIWDRTVADLARDHRVVRFDARGHGRSSSTTGDHSPPDDMLAVLDHLELARPVIVGNSLGGRSAIDVALEHPGRVVGLVLVGPGLSGRQFRHDALTWQDDVQAAAAEALRTKDPGDLLETILRGEVDGSHRTPDQVDPAMRAEHAEIVLANLLTHYTNHGCMRGAGAVDRLVELTLPVLAMVGSLDFRDIVEIVALIGEQVPNARTLVLEGVGHMVQNEVPERFLAEVRAFLAEVEG